MPMGPKARVAVSRFEDRSAKGRSTGKIGDGMVEMSANALVAVNVSIHKNKGGLNGRFL
jgi:hypothetical protein